MNRGYSIFLFALAAFFIFIQSGFKQRIIFSNQPLEIVKNNYVTGLDRCFESIQALEQTAIQFQAGQTEKAQLQSAIIQARLDFKRIEFLMDYFDPYFVSKSINGAPLPKLEPKVPEINVLEPNGLQTLDELIFLGDLSTDINDIVRLSTKLKKEMKNAVQFQKQKRIQHRYILESIRSGVLRVFTLGLTGFDTPGSANAIPEAQVSMQSMFEALNSYKDMASNDAADIHKEIIQYFQNSITYLKLYSDFDSFDRLYFLKTFINPIYAKLYDLHRALHIEMSDEVDPTMSAVNYHSRKIFDKKFLNPGFYTEVAESDLFDPRKIDLGRTLFFDPVMSKDLSMSCASCHNPNLAFTDGLPKSKTNTPDVFTKRNSPSLINATYSGRFFWDLREYDLERQIKHVAMDKHEFNLDLLDLADRLKESSAYVNLFQEAYGKRDKYGISSWSISNALAAYVTSLSSMDSPFDQYVNEERSDIAEEVKEGFNLFMGKAACGTCHFAPVFNGSVPPVYQDSESEVLGVLVAYDTLYPVLDDDPGRLDNGRPDEEADHFMRSFKTVTVRNAELTAPYMHNGSINSLKEVVDFYNRGGGTGMGLDVPHQTLPPDPLGLDDSEMNALVAFMEALTDTTGLQEVPKTLPAFEQKPEWNDRLVKY